MSIITQTSPSAETRPKRVTLHYAFIQLLVEKCTDLSRRQTRSQAELAYRYKGYRTLARLLANRRTSSQLSERKRHFQAISRTHSLPIRAIAEPCLCSPVLPTELLDSIVHIAVTDALSSNIPDVFSPLKAIAMASWTLRELVFRHYLRTLHLTTDTQWASMYMLLLSLEARQDGSRGFTCVKNLSAPTKILTPKLTRLAMFTNLQDLTLNFSSEGLSTQHLCAKRIFQNLIDSSALKLTCLTLTALPRIDASLLRVISLSFPGIVNLYLSCTERLDFSHCWYCLEQSMDLAVHCPIPQRYLDAQDMATSFAEALRPIKNLANLHLGVYVSSDDLIYTHMAHAPQYQDDTQRASPPSPECDICTDMEKEVRHNELAASLIMAQKLKSLQTMGWSSFFSFGGREMDSKGEMIEGDQEEGTADETRGLDQDKMEEQCELRTKIWVLRVNGRVRVRRVPWTVAQRA
ncbi:hypothetical protein CPB85DRAFT_1252662 [Mucidula mucida]|nr:hypothetical protein CPB85DRAFT_1252662 [Mucidula mucida]